MKLARQYGDGARRAGARGGGGGGVASLGAPGDGTRRVRFLHLDSYAHEAISAELGVANVPTFQLWDEGKLVDEFTSASKTKMSVEIRRLAGEYAESA